MADTTQLKGGLSPEEIARYSRHVILPQVGMAGQEKLAAARVLVVGMGGLGSPVALYLAAAGVGTLGLADFDTVELHNLQRQIIHRTDRVGASKIESARAQIEGLNPHTVIREHFNGVTVENALGLFGEYDLVVDGTDNFPTRYLVNDAAFLTGTPLVYGSIFQFEGQVTVYDATRGGPCHRCLFPEMPEPGTVPNCEEAGVFGALCGLVGSMQAMEAIKYLAGIGESLAGRLMVFDALAMNFRTLKLKKNPGCPLCGEQPEILNLIPERYEFNCETAETMAMQEKEAPWEIDVNAADAWLKSDDAPYLLDVREPYEVAICEIEGAVNIPMRQIPDRMDAVPKDRPVLVYCHHGHRSMNVVKFLRERGFDQATNLGGGIHQWAQAIEPGMARY